MPHNFKRGWTLAKGALGRGYGINDMAVGKSSRGIEHPIASDMALVGDTRHELHYKPLPKLGPVIGPYNSSHVESDSRYDEGKGTGDGGEFSE